MQGEVVLLNIVDNVAGTLRQVNQVNLEAWTATLDHNQPLLP
jgi:hypothetical protein